MYKDSKNLSRAVSEERKTAPQGGKQDGLYGIRNPACPDPAQERLLPDWRASSRV